jgi:hypothetical protein
MKKTRTIKLVLISGLIGSGGVVFGNKINHNTLSFKSNDVIRAGYYSSKDTLEDHSGIGIISRGGFGIFGHHAHGAC